MMIKNKYIDPLTDFGFKRIFGTYENRKFLISFLNDLLDIEDKIVSIEYNNLEKLGLNSSDRKTIYDIYCTDEKNNNFIVELQRAKQKYFKDRSIYYTTFPIQEQSKHGDWDYKLKQVYFVGILDFTFKDGRLKEKIREAFDLAEFLAMSKDEQFVYQMDLKTRLDNKNAIDYAEEMGIKKAKFEVAKNLLQQGIDINVIIKSTGLTAEEIQSLL